MTSTDGRPVDADAAAAALARHAAPAPSALAIGESYLAVARLDATKARWVWLGAALSTVILLFMATHAITVEVLRPGGGFATSPVVDRRGTYVRLGLPLVGVPVVAAAATGLAASAGLAAGPAAVPDGLLEQPWSLCLLLAVISVAFAAAAGVVAGLALSRVPKG